MNLSIGGSRLQVLGSFLLDREQFVRINGVNSSILPVTVGVP